MILRTRPRIDGGYNGGCSGRYSGGQLWRLDRIIIGRGGAIHQAVFPLQDNLSGKCISSLLVNSICRRPGYSGYLNTNYFSVKVAD